MKKTSFLKLYFPIISILIFFIIGGIFSCDSSDILTNADEENLEILSTTKTGEQAGGGGITTDYCGEIKTAKLFYKNSKFGKAQIYNDDEFLYIKFTAFNRSKINKLDLYIGALEEMPVKESNTNGNDCCGCNDCNDNDCEYVNPDFKQFPIEVNIDPEKKSYIYKIALEELDECFVIAARVRVNIRNTRCKGKKHNIYLYFRSNEKNDCNKYDKFINYCVQECDGGNGGGGDDPCVYQSYDTTIYAGQTINVGSLTITNDANNLYITFNFIPGQTMTETQVYVGPASLVPRNTQGTPVPGLFPYKHENLNNVSSDTYTIPLAGLPPCYVIAAHASTTAGETAWSNGTSFNSLWGTPRWGWVTNYCTQVCEDQQQP